MADFVSSSLRWGGLVYFIWRAGLVLSPPTVTRAPHGINIAACVCSAGDALYGAVVERNGAR